MSGQSLILLVAALITGGQASGIGHAHLLPSVTSFPVVRYAPYYNFPHSVRSIHAVAHALPAVAPAVPALAPPVYPRFAAPLPAVPAFAPPHAFAPPQVFAPPPVFAPAPRLAPGPLFAPAPPPVFAHAHALAPPPVFAPAVAPALPAFAPPVAFSRSIPYAVAPHANHLHVLNKFVGHVPQALFSAPHVKQYW